MKLSRGTFALVISLGALFLIGVLFEPFVVDKILVPIAAAIWLLLRIFVFSVDQKYYWFVLLVVGFPFVLCRAINLLSYRLRSTRMDRSPDASVALMSAEVWRNSIALAAGGKEARTALKHELGRVLVSLYTFRRSGSAYFEVYEPLRQGKIPLPEGVHAFIFAKGSSVRKLNRWQSIRLAAQNWFRKWTGREAAECHLAVDEVLDFMEASLEMNDDKQ
jgi:hypothetical protein